jgi:predicted nucleic acid-binding Zn ribbon protein
LTHLDTADGAAFKESIWSTCFASVPKLIGRIAWFAGADGKPAKQPQENHCWLIWDWSRTSGIAGVLWAGKDAESEPETRWCIVCRTPLPLMARADKRYCSPRCRQHSSRQSLAQRRTA